MEVTRYTPLTRKISHSEAGQSAADKRINADRRKRQWRMATEFLVGVQSLNEMVKLMT